MLRLSTLITVFQKVGRVFFLYIYIYIYIYFKFWIMNIMMFSGCYSSWHPNFVWNLSHILWLSCHMTIWLLWRAEESHNRAEWGKFPGGWIYWINKRCKWRECRWCAASSPSLVLASVFSLGASCSVIPCWRRAERLSGAVWEGQKNTH